MRGRAFRYVAPGLTLYNLQVFEPTADDVDALLTGGWTHEADAQEDLSQSVLFFTTDESVAANAIFPGGWEETDAFPPGPPVEAIDTDTGDTWDLTTDEDLAAYNDAHPDTPVEPNSDPSA